MEKNKTYYYVTIVELNGEFEYMSSFLSQRCADEDEYEFFDRIKKEFRGGSVDDGVDENGDLWVDGTIVDSPEYLEIPKEDFEVMAKYLTVVNPN
jgi:hypothetical protein